MRDVDTRVQISVSHLQAMCREAGQEVDSLLAAIDPAGAGRLSFPAFCRGVAALMAGPQQREEGE